MAGATPKRDGENRSHELLFEGSSKFFRRASWAASEREEMFSTIPIRRGSEMGNFCMRSTASLTWETAGEGEEGKRRMSLEFNGTCCPSIRQQSSPAHSMREDRLPPDTSTGQEKSGRVPNMALTFSSASTFFSLPSLLLPPPLRDLGRHPQFFFLLPFL